MTTKRVLNGQDSRKTSAGHVSEESAGNQIIIHSHVNNYMNQFRGFLVNTTTSSNTTQRCLLSHTTQQTRESSHLGSSRITIHGVDDESTKGCS